VKEEKRRRNRQKSKRRSVGDLEREFETVSDFQLWVDRPVQDRSEKGCRGQRLRGNTIKRKGGGPKTPAARVGKEPVLEPGGRQTGFPESVKIGQLQEKKAIAMPGELNGDERGRQTHQSRSSPAEN